MLGSNFHFCARRLNFSKQSFFDQRVDVNDVLKQQCLLMIYQDDMRFSVAQFFETC